MNKQRIEITINPNITPDELYEFYKANDICEEGYGKEVASRVLNHSSLIVGAFLNNKLVGITRAMFDGLCANIVEFCLALELQGKGLEYDNGSIIEKDFFLSIGFKKNEGHADYIIDRRPYVKG